MLLTIQQAFGNVVRDRPWLSMLNRVYKTYSFRGFNGKKLTPYTFNIFAHFYHFHGKLSIWKMLMCTLFYGKGVWKSVCFVKLFKCWHLWTVPKVLCMYLCWCEAISLVQPLAQRLQLEGKLLHLLLWLQLITNNNILEYSNICHVNSHNNHSISSSYFYLVLCTVRDHSDYYCGYGF